MWLRIACLLMLGYLSVSRAFAYLGIPAWKVFIGEVVLALFLLWGPKINGMRWLWASHKLPSLRRLWSWYALFFAYGVLQVLHGVQERNPLLIALRDLAFNFYPIYFFLGIWAGGKRPDLLPKLLRGFAWLNGIYGVLYLLYLNRVEWRMPGVSVEVAPVPVFGQPIYSFVALLGLLAYEKDIRQSWHLLLLNGFVMLGMQIRTEWLAFTVGVVAWSFMTGRGKRALQAGTMLVSLLAVMYVTDFRLPSPLGRADADFSARQLVDRARAPLRADLSDLNAAAGLGNVDSQEATFVFRTVWWLAIWDSAHEDLHTALLGHGYGFALGDVVPYLEGRSIRTPHNEFLYALGYTGWVGVVFFCVFQLAILQLLWQARRVTGEAFGVAYWAAMVALGMFFPLGETPYAAIPFYLITGWIAAAIRYGEVPIQMQATRHVAPSPTGGQPELVTPDG